MGSEKKKSQATVRNRNVATVRFSFPVLSANRAYMSLWEQECVTLVTISAKSGSMFGIFVLRHPPSTEVG
jgi:hypothetical protein